MKKSALFLALTLLSAAPLWATDNLISNGDFETSSNSSFFGVITTSFEDWTWDGGAEVLAVETTNVYSGAQALHLNGSKITRSAGTLYNGVALLDDEVNQKYELTIHYKVITANEGDIELNSAWTYIRPGSEGHDANVLVQKLATTGEGWQELKVSTTKPTDGSNLNVGVKVTKGAEVLFDDFSLVRVSATPTALQNNSATPSVQVQKVLHNGQIYIVRDGKFYTLAGTEVKEMR